MKKLFSILLFFTFFSGCAQVYSKYFFLDTLKDKGITSELHSKYKNKIYFGKDPSSNGSEKDSLKNILEFNRNDNVEGELYFDRSPRYYYAKNQSDKNLKFSDWDYNAWKGNYYNNGGKNDGRYVGYLLFVMIINGDTACTWKSSLFERVFADETAFHFKLWENTNNNKNMGDENEFWPLFTYVKEKKKSGILNIQIDVYAGKLVCKSVQDRGPDKLASGFVKFNITSGDLEYLKDLSNKSCKLKFQDYDLENKLLWGVKQ